MDALGGALPAAGLAGVIVTLFAIMCRQMLAVSKRADENCAETAARLERERDAANDRADTWQRRYFDCMGISFEEGKAHDG